MENLIQYRLNEIIFCNLFKHLMNKSKNPIKIYNMIELMANIAGGNIIILNNVITIILNNDRRYMPTKQEYVAAMRECGVPVRTILARVGMSFTTYYKWKKEEILITPRFTPAQYNEMIKVLNLFSDIYDSMEGYDGNRIYKSETSNVSTGV